MAKFEVGDKIERVGDYAYLSSSQPYEILYVGEQMYFFKDTDGDEDSCSHDYFEEEWAVAKPPPPGKGEKWTAPSNCEYAVIVHSVTDGIVFYSGTEYPDEYFGTAQERFTEYFTKVEDNG